MTVLLLLITCANIAGLQIARASARVKEISIRLAIGASRGRVVLPVADRKRVIVGSRCDWPPSASHTSRCACSSRRQGKPRGRLQLVTTFLDTRVLGVHCSPGRGDTVLVGLVPALLATRPAVWPALRAGVAAEIGGHCAGAACSSPRKLALGLVLVTASGLFGRTVYNLRHTDTGFQTDRLVQFQLNPGAAGLRPRSAPRRCFGQALEAIRALPGVSSATLVCRARARQRDDRVQSGGRGLYACRDGDRARARWPTPSRQAIFEWWVLRWCAAATSRRPIRRGRAVWRS